MTKLRKNHLVLLKLIEKNDNSFCADCGLPGTRWASWNLGIFICIRCAGIHRNLGVHISKVKSVDLDSWTKEQLQSMESMGNKKSKSIYEASLPEIYSRPQTNNAVEDFIRAKYQHKIYCFPNTSFTIKNSNLIDLEVIENKKPQSNEEFRELYGYNDPGRKCESEGDDSLSDPEYILEHKNIRKKYKKIKSCMAVPDVNPNNNIKETPITISSKNHVTTTISLPSHCDNYNMNKSYQIPSNETNTNVHRSYGSSSEPGYYNTSNIPEYGATNYLRQIQEKLTRLRVNLTSKYRQYEEPSNEPTSQEDVATMSTRGTFLTRSTSQYSGQTLSPELWR